VVSGYVAMLLLIMLFFLLIAIIFPSAFPQPDSFPSIPWVVVILLFGLGAAVVGAGVTTVICRGSRLKHIHALALVVLFIGLVTLAANIDKQPLWYLVTQVLIGLVGVYVGGHFANKRFPQEAVRIES
jgi:uncharacterized membrane protein YhaH (DUF805 family)